MRSGEVGREAVLHEVGEVEPEPLDGVGVVGSEGEHLLELVEDEQRGEGLVLGAPPLDMATVKVFPEALALVGRVGVNALHADFGLQRRGSLLESGAERSRTLSRT